MTLTCGITKDLHDFRLTLITKEIFIGISDCDSKLMYMSLKLGAVLQL